jgi:hypothetical protein
VLRQFARSHEPPQFFARQVGELTTLGLGEALANVSR